MEVPNGYLPETWAIVSGQHRYAPIKDLTDGDPSVQRAMTLNARAKELGAMEALLAGDGNGRDVPVRRTNSATELMAAVLATGGIGTK